MKPTTKIESLKKTASAIRKDILRSLAAAGSGHTGGSLGLADIFTCLYFHSMHHRPEEPGWPDRDRLILSIGHVAPVLYTTLAHAGYFSREELKTLRKLGTRLQGHPGREHGLPGLELSAGSLGQGLSVAVGMALAAKIDHKDYQIFSIHGDGELQEGSVWEAAMSASHHKLDNMIAIVDRNQLQIDGKTSEVMQLEPLADKWASFGWEVFHCNGHDHEDIIRVVDRAKKAKGKPKVILARTVMGKGVKTIENDHRWHGKAPGPEQLEDFLKQIDEADEV
ncbi:MAG: transketolase [Bacteroidota bacterium]|nr:transketolase [Bacteroidota bacterium]